MGRGGGEGRALGVGVIRGDAVAEGVRVGVAVGVGVEVAVEVGLGVADGVGVVVGVPVAVAVAVALAVGVDVGVAVDVVVGVAVGVDVGVGVGATVFLFTIAPKVPTAVALSGSGADTPQSPSDTPLCSRFQEAPPSVVRRAVSPKPTMVPLFASAKETPVRMVVAGN